jgi:4'-phosphopantetheinyl transferase
VNYYQTEIYQKYGSLAAGEVHLWVLHGTTMHTNACDCWAAELPPDELARGLAMKSERARREFFAARTFLRRVLGTYLNERPVRVKLLIDLNRKPYLACPKANRLNFNLSHGDGHVAVAIAFGARIGVDIEALRFRPRSHAVARRHFTVAEVAALCNLTPEQQQKAFVALWTAKEAILKARGDGLRSLVRSVALNLTPNGEVSFAESRSEPIPPYTLLSFETALVYGHVAVLEAGWHIRKQLTHVIGVNRD